MAEKTVKHTNFYENLAEAQMRLCQTVIVYDHKSEPPYGIEPYYVAAITDHKKDGKFRIYLEPLHRREEYKTKQLYTYDTEQYPRDHPQLGVALDAWMALDANKDYLLRKRMDSPCFNNFRPFPIGMCNLGGRDGRCIYIERQPQRHREQGLTNSMTTERPVSLGGNDIGPVSRSVMGSTVRFMTPAFRACVRGEYPSAKEVLAGLNNPEFKNEAIGFARFFALVRGPMDLLFLGYKDKIIGLLPHGDLTEVRLGREYAYTREAVEELKLFDRINQK